MQEAALPLNKDKSLSGSGIQVGAPQTYPRDSTGFFQQKLF